MAKKWVDVKNKKEDVLAELKTCAESTSKTAALAKVNAVKKWRPDSGTLAAIQKSYDEATKVVAKAAPQNIDVALKSYTRPKFAHNATNAGTLPVWTFQYTDTAPKKTGTVDITMSRSMTKDEPTAKKMMADAAAVKKNYPATVKINNSTLDA
jgi:hypothetical protein